MESAENIYTRIDVLEEFGKMIAEQIRRKEMVRTAALIREGYNMLWLHPESPDDF